MTIITHIFCWVFACWTNIFNLGIKTHCSTSHFHMAFTKNWPRLCQQIYRSIIWPQFRIQRGDRIGLKHLHSTLCLIPILTAEVFYLLLISQFYSKYMYLNVFLKSQEKSENKKKNTSYNIFTQTWWRD